MFMYCPDSYDMKRFISYLSVYYINNEHDQYGTFLVQYSKWILLYVWLIVWDYIPKNYDWLGIYFLYRGHRYDIPTLW